MILLTLFLLFVAACAIPISEEDHNEQEHMKYFLYEDENGQIQKEQLEGVPLNLNASASDVIYYYFSKSNPTNGVEIHSNNLDALKKTAYSSRKDTIFITHGWKNSKESDVNSHIREYCLRDHDINVFVVDWSPIAGRTYGSAQGNVKVVGEYVADFARDLSSKYGLNLSKLKLVGHSLGAHISGCIGAALDGQVDRIVGLDPAGPLFTVKNTDNRLDPTDAKFVQIIHTNDGLLGFKGRLGHADYYPNGGKSQPGCGVDLVGTCAHSRAYAYYAESLTSNKFVGKKCGSYKDFSRGNCDQGESSSMGQFDVDTSASGEYYLDTNKNAPYAKG